MKEQINPSRKHLRLRTYDYSQNGAYFVTICTAGRKRILSEIVPAVGPDALIGPVVRLTEIGRIAEKHIRGTEAAYPGVSVEHYAIMPNHVHLLLRMEQGGASGPSLGLVIKAFKGLVSREVGYGIWQTNYYEHIIRDDNDFLTRWRYIDENPARWGQDEYYPE